MRRALLRLTAGLGAGLALLGGCEKKAPATISMPPPPAVTVAHPIEREVTDYDEFPGRVEALESVDIRARVGGYLERILFKPGADVKEGDVLFEIDPKPFKAVLDQAQAQVAQAEASLKEREIEAARLTDLMKTQSASPIELDRAIAQRDATKASVQAAKASVEQAQLNVDYTTVKAPIGGRISRNLVDVGNLIMGGQTQATLLTTIVALDPIYAYFNIDEQTVLRLRQRIMDGQMKNYKEADIPVQLGLATEDGFPHAGRIDFVENRLASDTGTLSVRAIFENKGDGFVRMLSPGMFARIRLRVGTPYPAVLVPERALGSDQGQRFLLVVNDQNVVEHRIVRIGRQDRDFRVVQDGIRPDEWIITTGLQRVRPGVTVKPQQTSVTQPHPGNTTQTAPGRTQ